MYIISKATTKEIEIICQLGAQTFTDAYAANNTKEDLDAYLSKSFSKKTIRDELENPDTSYFLCYDGEKAVGYLKLNFNTKCEAFEENNVTELQRIYTLKEYYHKKVGKQLMQFAIDICTAKNYAYLWLGVWKENHRALPFYKAWGFTIIGEREFIVGNKKYADYYLRMAL